VAAKVIYSYVLYKQQILTTVTAYLFLISLALYYYLDANHKKTIFTEKNLFSNIHVLKSYDTGNENTMTH